MPITSNEAAQLANEIVETPLPDEDAESVLDDWSVWARPSQLPPAKLADGRAWRVWLLLAGRGFGKTRSGAEWVRAQAESGAAQRIALVAPTARDARLVMVEGESGLLAIASDHERPVFEPSKRQLTWPNGAIATLFSADEPDRLRGPQFDAAWCDELAAWRYPAAWDMLMMGLRLGKQPRVVVTTTPKPVKLIRALLASPDCAVTRGGTRENEDNLAPGFLAAILKQYDGTRLGRQELDAELLEDMPGALWTRDAIERARIDEAPGLRRVVVAIDPAASAGEDADETGIVVAALGQDSQGYVLADFAVAQRVADAFAPKPASPAAMSVVVDAGFTVATGPSGLQSVVEIGAQTLTIAAAPGAPNNRIDLVALDETSGTASVITGTPAGAPVAPALTAGKKQIALISVPNGTSSIANGNITDLRAVWQTTVPGVRWAIAGGSADAITASYTPANAALADGLILGFRATAANATTTPSFNADGLGAKTIVKQGGAPLAPGDVPGALAECMIRYNAANARWELLNPTASGFTTGDVKTTLKTVADAGWVMMNDGTIGDASSGATTRANADTQALFTLLWTNVSNTNCPVAGGRGVSAAADFAAHKTIALPKTLGRALASAGTGAGLSARNLGDAPGEETHTLTVAEMPAHSHTYSQLSSGVSGSIFWGPGANDTVTEDTSSVGGGAAHNNVQPTSFLNVMIKL